MSAVGLGCMGMSDFYGHTSPAGTQAEVNSLATIRHALDLGVTLLDTADMYGPFTNERLLGTAIRGRRDDVVVATKLGIDRNPADGARRGVNGRPEYVHQAADASLRRLGIDHIDPYYQHRVDPDVPIEETIGAMSELVAAGKVRHAPGSASLVGARPHGGLIAPEPRAGMATGVKAILGVLGVVAGVAFLLLLVGVATGFGQEVAAGAGSSTTRTPLLLRRGPA